MKKYYYAKIGQGNKQAEVYLNGKNEINHPAIPIYFNCEYNNKEDFLKFGNAREQGVNFFECGENNKDKFIIVIHKGLVRFLIPAGDVVFKKSKLQDKNNGCVKLLPVKEIKSSLIAEVPAILASIAANRYYSSGTFREIKNTGNIISIQATLGQRIESPHTKSVKSALICLSSFEFETLIAKLFEEAGCFVPAYRGGNMQGADLFAHNITSNVINIYRLSIQPSKKISIQVKLKSNLKHPPPGIDIMIGIDVHESDTCLGSAWLIKALADSQATLRWLKQSLKWLPIEYLNASIP